MDRYGLIGNPLGHSFSADYFNRKFRKETIDAEYSLYPLASVNELERLLEDVPDLRGLNVTIPYKQQVIPLLDSLDETAGKVGAVNVIKITHENGRRILRGYNSDTIGFRGSLEKFLRPDITKALVLGTGGAAKAVNAVLSGLGMEVTAVSRTQRNASANVFRTIPYADVTPQTIADHLLIVNTTPVGMFPHTEEAPDIPYHLLTPRHVCFDLVYNPELTLFMKLSREAGAQVSNGLEMLHLQAEGAWTIWNS